MTREFCAQPIGHGKSAPRYEIKVALLPEKGRYEGVLRAFYTNAGNHPLTELVLLTGKAEIAPDSLESARAFTAAFEESRLRVRFGKPLQTGESVRIRLRFGAPLPGAEHWGDAFEEFAGVQLWYPRFENEPETGCAYEVCVNAPEGQAVFGSGRREGRRFSGENIQNFGFVATGRFPYVAQQTDGGEFTVIYPPDGEALARSVLDTAKEAAAFYKKRMGFFPALSFTAVPGNKRWVGGCPIANGMVHFHGMQRIKGAFGYDNWIVAHELAHQYFGERVDFSRISWVWLGLGLSLDHAFMRETGRDMGVYARFARLLREAVTQGRAGIPQDEARLRALLADESFDYNTNVLHAKAVAIMLALQETIGRETYFRIVACYLREFGCRTVDEAAFIRLCERESGRPLRAIFERWLRENAYPAAGEA